MAKKKKIPSMEQPQMHDDGEMSPTDLTSEFIEEDNTAEHIEPIKEIKDDYENHPKFHKFKGESE